MHPIRKLFMWLALFGACHATTTTDLAVDADTGSRLAMPIEVLGPAMTTSSVAFSLSDSGARTLHLRTHGLNFQAAGSLQINDGPWIDLNNANSALTVIGTAASFGGIGGAFTVISMNLALTGTELVTGRNTVAFRFNGTDGRSSGFRVLDFNLLDDQGTALLPASLFVQEDPSTWTAPHPDEADLQAGQNLWNTATLIESPINANHVLLAHCSDCHSVDGRDLKYFSYSNNSIIQRSVFHGLTEAQGELIASFIRSNPSPAPGRVYNPPFQPGPGADAAPLSEWSAGMGIDAVLDSDSLILSSLPASAAAMREPATSGATLRRYNIREAPIALPLLDWNHWLPSVSPADALGSVDAFRASTAYQAYQTIRAGLADPATRGAYVQSQLLNDSTTWYLTRGALEAAITTHNGTGTEAAFVDNYNAAVWSAQKMWEVVQEFDLQGAGQQLYGLNGERASWFITNRFIFDVSPHAINNVSGAPDLTTYQVMGDATLGNTCPVTPGNKTGSCRILMNEFIASNWYDVQLQLNGGMRRSAMAVHQIVDWGYMKNFENVGVNSGFAQPLRLARFAAKAMDELDTGIGPDNISWGWNYRDEVTQFMQIAAESQLPSGWASNPAYAKSLTSLYQTWLEKTASFDPAMWQASQGKLGVPLSGEYDGVNFPPSSYVLNSGSFPNGGSVSDNLNRSFIDQYVKELPALVALHQPAALVNGMTNFGALLYPSNNWVARRVPVSAAVAAPSGVVVVASGTEELTVTWNAVAGATSYNVKRAAPGLPALTVAYFVADRSFVDREVQPGKTYAYTISANTTADAAEGPDSQAVAAPPIATGLVMQWMLGDTLVDGAVVPEIASSAPRNSGKVFRTPEGDAYVSLAQNTNRWLGNTTTLTASIQLSPGATGVGSAGASPAITGSTGRTNQDYYFGVLNAQGKVGAGVMGCDGTTASQPVVYSTQALNDGAWHRIAITRNVQSGTIQVYVDGVLSNSGVSGTGRCEGISRSLGRIDSTTSGRGWPGLLKDVRIYDTVLSSAAIAGGT